MEQKLSIFLVKTLTWEALLSMRRSKYRTLNQTQVCNTFHMTDPKRQVTMHSLSNIIMNLADHRLYSMLLTFSFTVLCGFVRAGTKGQWQGLSPAIMSMKKL